MYFHHGKHIFVERTIFYLNIEIIKLSNSLKNEIQKAIKNALKTPCFLFNYLFKYLKTRRFQSVFDHFFKGGKKKFSRLRRAFFSYFPMGQKTIFVFLSRLLIGQKKNFFACGEPFFFVFP